MTVVRPLCAIVIRRVYEPFLSVFLDFTTTLTFFLERVAFALATTFFLARISKRSVVLLRRVAPAPGARHGDLLAAAADLAAELDGELAGGGVGVGFGVTVGVAVAVGDTVGMAVGVAVGVGVAVTTGGPTGARCWGRAPASAPRVPGVEVEHVSSVAAARVEGLIADARRGSSCPR